MLDKKIKEALELLGGRAIIVDDNQCYVLLNLKEFRKIKQEGIEGLTKAELIDKINNDIASWKFSQEEKKTEEIALEEIGDIKDDEVTYEKA